MKNYGTYFHRKFLYNNVDENENDEINNLRRTYYTRQYFYISTFFSGLMTILFIFYTSNYSANVTSSTDLYTNDLPNFGATYKPTYMATFPPKEQTKTVYYPSIAPTQLPTHLPSKKTVTFSFTTNRDGYESLPYFSVNPSSIYKYNFLENYDGIVEPYADMWLNVTSDSSDYYYKYNICDTTTNECITGKDYADSFNFGCTTNVNTFTVTVIEYKLKNGVKTGQSTTGNFLCMYVRREIRSLTDADLDKTMETMWALWKYDDATGQSIYGDNYHNYKYLLNFHYFNAAWMHSDHIHEGNGFQAQHIKMSNMFEVAMQAVDPSITLPYWDFTIETASNIAVWDSPVFTKDTFGSLPLPNNYTWGWLYSQNSIDDGRIPDGRWENLEVDMNTKFDDLYYAYGYMRSPWNVNPSKYIARYTSIDKTLPTCSSHYSLLEYDEIVDFLHEIPYAAHAATHGAIGGVFGCDAMTYLRDAGYINDVEGQLDLCKNWIFYLKEFYRSDILVPSDDCTSVNDKGEYSVNFDDMNCVYECNADREDVLVMMLQHSILNSEYECVPAYGVMPDEGWDAWVNFICGGYGSKIFGGDHLESASPADPSFWPIHPTLERILQVKYMAGGFNSDDWPNDPDNDYVCNKVTCYDEDIGEFGHWDMCCYGHYQDDQLLDAPNNDKYSYVGATNREIFEGTNPKNIDYNMPYIYDKFTWEHCLLEDLDFDELITDLYNDFTYNTSIPDSEKGW